jgi:plastocyanin
VLLLVAAGVPAEAQTASLSVRVQLFVDHKSAPEKNNSGVAVWLEPLKTASIPEKSPHASDHFAVVQQGHAFVPHVLIVPVGAKVEFPNHDLVFHNAFSLFDGERFDLGLYEGGGTKRVLFDRPGIAYVFCNIHYDMSAVVVALSTPYYGLTDRHGLVKLVGVPPGQYRLRIWAEGASPDTLMRLSRELRIDKDLSIGNIRVETAPMLMTHTNKYGLPYDTQTNKNVYAH